MECVALDFRCQCTQQKLQSICAVLTIDLQLKKILTFSVKDKYQLNYFICIKDLNTETITSLKLDLFSFFICFCQHYETKTICLYVFMKWDRYCGTEHQYLFSRFFHRYSNSGPPFFLIWSLPRLWYGSLSGSISLNHLSIFYNISCYNSLVLLTCVSRSSCRFTKKT